jgi:hypothetical protein
MSVPSTTSILANLAPTLFQGGPSDIVATPDVYTLNSNTINANTTVNTNVGKYNPSPTGVINNLLTGSTGILSSLTSLSSLSSLTATVVSITAASTLSRLASATGIPVNSMTAGMQVAIGTALNLNANNFNTALVSVGNSTVSVNTNDVPTTVSLIGMVNQLAGETIADATDVGASATAASAITNQLITAGLSSVLEGFITSQTQPTITNNGTTTQTVGQVALSQNVMTAIQASDLTTLQLCITQLGVGGVLQQVPNAALLLLQNYAIPAGTAASGYAACWTALEAILVQLAPNWETTQRGGTTVDSLTYFQSASKDAITVMLAQTAGSDPIALTGAAIASGFQSEATLTTLQQMYPNMLVLTSSAA